jgi:hypothetical protein
MNIAEICKAPTWMKRDWLVYRSGGATEARQIVDAATDEGLDRMIDAVRRAEAMFFERCKRPESHA